MKRTASKRAVEWLAAAAPDPRKCKRDWEHGESGTTLLAAGRLWDVLIVPEDLGLFTLDVLLRLPLFDPGPVLADFDSHRIGFFLPPDTSSLWTGAGVRYARKGTWIVAPAPMRTTGAIRWLEPPDGSGLLNSPDILELALRRAAVQLATTLEGSGTGAH
ncbi:hypothetical protein ABT009_03685 [Streptomyces sp. NPDC002896]|uniref:hypothetical protein n=1 Tax=Streptomyces sp. NPDC002896 TaxID=3154438 RepID=UPI0033318A95